MDITYILLCSCIVMFLQNHYGLCSVIDYWIELPVKDTWMRQNYSLMFAKLTFVLMMLNICFIIAVSGSIIFID